MSYKVFQKVIEDSFLDELGSIKEAGIASWLGGGVKTLGRLARSSGLGGKASFKGLHRLGKSQYRAAGGGWKGARAVMGGQVGQAAGVAGLGGLAGYGGYKALTGGGQRRYR